MQNQPVDQPLFPRDPASRNRVIPAILIAAIAVFIGYIGMVQPVHEALAGGGPVRYYVKGVILPPVFLYLAITMLIVDIRDGQIMHVNAKNKKTLTRKGWWVMLGAVAVAALSYLAWIAYLRTLGFHSAA